MLVFLHVSTTNGAETLYEWGKCLVDYLYVGKLDQHVRANVSMDIVSTKAHVWYNHCLFGILIWSKYRYPYVCWFAASKNTMQKC